MTVRECNIFKKQISKGLSIEVSHHGYENTHKIWCYYLMINKKIYMKYWDEIKGLVGYGVGFEDIDFHGGITWKSIEKSYFRTDEVSTILRVGCDYNHLWDIDQYYNVTHVLAHAERTAKEFMDKYPIGE